MRCATCGTVKNAVTRPAPAVAAEPDHPDQAHAGHVKQRAPDQRDQHGLAEVRLQHQQRDDDDQQRQRDACWPAFPAASPVSPNSQAIRMTKAGLRNSDGCTLTPRITSQRRAPLISAPKYGVTAVSRRLTMNTTSATLRMSRGDRNEVAMQHAGRRDQEHAPGG